MKTNESSVRKKIGAFAAKIMPKVKGFVKDNWGAPFIVGFVALLLVAAVSLSIGFAVLADEIGVYAYYALVVGVVLQLACFWKYRNRKGEPSQ